MISTYKNTFFFFLVFLNPFYFNPNHQSENISSFQEDFKVTVLRQYPAAGCTSGYLAVNGNIICYTVEKLLQRDNQNNIEAPYLQEHMAPFFGMITTTIGELSY